MKAAYSIEIIARDLVADSKPQSSRLSGPTNSLAMTEQTVGKTENRGKIHTDLSALQIPTPPTLSSGVAIPSRSQPNW